MHAIRVPGRTNVTVLLHERPHLSDLLARYLIHHYDVEGKLTGEVPIGRGGGPFDEHRDPALQECEATLVAKFLGVRELPELERLLDYTLKVDRYGQGKGALMFGRLVELMWDVHPNEPWRAEQWAEVMIEAEIERARGNQVEVSPEHALNLVRIAFHSVKRGFTDEETATLREVLTFERPRGYQGRWDPFKSFSLPYCAAVLWMRFQRIPGKPSVLPWLADALRAELVKQREFLASAADLERSLMADIVVLGKTVKVFTVTTDNARFHSWAFHTYPSAVVVAVRRSNGNVQILRNPRPVIPVELWSVVAQLRAIEQERRGKPVSSWDELTRQQGPPGAEHLFFHHATQSAFVGSLTAPVAEPLAATDEEVQRCLVAGLSDSNEEYRSWLYLERGGPVSEPVRRLVVVEVGDSPTDIRVVETSGETSGLL